MKHFPLLLIFVLATVACGPKQDVEADAAAIRQLQEEAIRTFNASDIPGLLALYAEDAVRMPPNQPAARGKQAIEEQYRELFNRFSCQLAAAPEEIVVTGDWAFVRGSYSLRLTPKAGGEPVPDEGKYLDIYQKQPNEVWRLDSRMWNSNKPGQELAGAAAKPTTQAAQPTRRPSGAARFAVQLGAFEKRSDAEALARKITDRYKLSVQVAPATVEGRTVYRVRIPADSKAQAETVAARIGAEQNLKTWVVSLP